MQEPDYSKSKLMHKTACIETCRGQDAVYAIYTQLTYRCNCAQETHVNEFDGKKAHDAMCKSTDNHWVGYSFKLCRMNK